MSSRTREHHLSLKGSEIQKHGVRPVSHRTDCLQARMGFVKDQISKRLEVFLIIKEYVLPLITVVQLGEFNNVESGATSVAQAMASTLSSLILLGEIGGFFEVDSTSNIIVDSSNAVHVRLFVNLMEVLHMWCMRHPPSGVTPKDRVWKFNENDILFHSSEPLRRLDMHRAVLGVVESVLPRGFLIWKDYELRKHFVSVAEQIMDNFDSSCCDSQPIFPYRKSSGFHIYVRDHRVKDGISQKFRKVMQVGVCLSNSHEIESSAEWVLYSSLKARRGVCLYAGVVDFVESKICFELEAVN